MATSSERIGVVRDGGAWFLDDPYPYFAMSQWIPYSVPLVRHDLTDV